MARGTPTRRDRPLSTGNFLVDLGFGDARSRNAGFCRVGFPSFDLQPKPDEPPPRLVLTRGATGALELYQWWEEARGGKPPRRRTITIRLLDDDRVTVVVTWRFTNARPVALAYSPLDAIAGGVLMETIELAFDDVEVS